MAGGPAGNKGQVGVVTYRDIKADILGRITRGEWKPGSLIPGELELAETYGSARATVNRAMRELAEDGIIERKRKSGSRVRSSPCGRRGSTSRSSGARWRDRAAATATPSCGRR